MHMRSEAIICSVLNHGENGAVVRVFTPEHGLQAGYVRGAKSIRLRPILIPGNLVAVELRSRTEDALGSLSCELVHSRAALLREPLAAAAIGWICALTATALPESHAYSRLYELMSAGIAAIEHAPAARGWGAALVQYELLLLAELGFGLDLESCAVTEGQDDLIWVSPRSARAVSKAGARGYERQLLPLPSFLREGGAAGWDDILAGMRLTGYFLERNILTERRENILFARDRLIERIKRLV